MVLLIKRISSLLRKIALVVFVFSAVIALFTYLINKDKPQFTDNITAIQRNEIYQTINDPKLNKTQAGKISISMYRSLTCKVLGEGCTLTPTDGDKYVGSSLLGGMAKAFIYPFVNPPASGVYWTYNSLEKAGFTPKAYAAEGIGFSGLKPLIGLWTVFRNISYMLLVLVLIAIGFMIMFRMKLNPQTVISVENALPKIVISMVLITFSYAIAGVLVDLMYVIMAIGIAVIGNNGQYYNIAETQIKYLSANPGHLFLGFFASGTWGVDYLFYIGNAILWMLGPITGILRIVVGFFTVYFLNMFVHWVGPEAVANAPKDVQVQAATFGAGIGGLLNLFIDPSLKGLEVWVLAYLGMSILTPLLLGILIFFTILLLFFRLFFTLIKAYTNIILMVVFSPLYLLMEAIPGSKTGFSDWLKNLFAELMTFPVVAILFNVGYVIANTMTAAQNSQTTIVGTTNTLWAPPFLGGFDPKAFSLLLGVILVFLIPDFIKQMKEMLGAKGMGVNFGAGTLFAGGATVVGGAMGMLGTYSSIAMAFPKIRQWANKQDGILGMFGDVAKGSGTTAAAIDTKHQTTTDKTPGTSGK